jgi:ATPase subunit of ABC transporter with duplicated ATPase domains
MLILHDMAYVHPNKDVLFAGLNLIINKHDKIALIGNNGAGKSTLLKLLAGNLYPSAGTIRADAKPYLVPQVFGQFNNYTIAGALRIEDKLRALKQILQGDVTSENMTLLNDDWAIEERCSEAFARWNMKAPDLTHKMEGLSGGQKTKVFLAGIHIHQPEIVLLDEPSNHLDISSRNILYDYISTTTNTLLVVSHDKTLLNLCDIVYELHKQSITVYGGNYNFYVEQKKIADEAFNQELKSKEKALRKAKDIERESTQRQQKLDARGKKKQEKAGLPTISMKTFKNNAEKSTSRMKGVHEEKVTALAHELNTLRKTLPDVSQMKMNIESTKRHRGKILVTANQINFRYEDHFLWNNGLSFQISSSERLAIKGSNGTGKTTLLKIILGRLKPSTGSLSRIDVNTLYIDQDYSLIDNHLSVYDQAWQFNTSALQEHDIKIRLNRFLFTTEHWNKPCEALSGGEKMRLMLCCLTISNKIPDVMDFDEPTNNLDIHNINILTSAIKEYKGTLIVISHDVNFLNEVGIEREMMLD